MPALTNSSSSDWQDPEAALNTGSLLNAAMRMLSDHPNAVFLGQSVRCPGVSMFHDLEGVPMEQRIEMPVAENLQMGISTGLAIAGYLPISIFPRCDFLMCAMDQLVLHLEKLEQMSRGQFKPKVIIRTRVGSKTPLDAGPQHTNDFTDVFRMLLRNVHVSEITQKSEILTAYRNAIASTISTLIVENL